MPANPEAGCNECQVIMWVLESVSTDADLCFSRLREAGVTGIPLGVGDSPEPALAHGFGFYAEHIHRIACLHDREMIPVMAEVQ